MKRRILFASVVMIMMLGSQVQMEAHRRGGPYQKRPGVEMRCDCRPCRPMKHKAISQGDIYKVQNFYRRKYGIILSKSEAERILISRMKEKKRHNGYSSYRR